jgi:hypothetical protein
MTEEHWLEIPGYEPYQASSLGRRRGIRFGHILTPVKTQYGYHQVSLCVNGKKFSRLVHRLVAYAFIGPQPSPEYDVLHWDGDKTNNALSNLRWGTPKDNNDDQVRHNTRVLGSRHPLAKLTEGKVREIRDLWNYGKLSQAEISEAVGVPRRTINGVIRGATWKHVA